MLPVPLYGLREPLGEVRVDGPPVELALQLRGVDRIAPVVAGAVAHPVEGILGLAHEGEDLAQDVDVGALPIGAYEVGLADPAFRQDVPDGAGVVLGVYPVPDILPRAVELGADAAEDVRDLARDELLHMLVGPVVVGAVRYRGPEAVGPRPGPDQQVGGCLRGGVGGARAVGVVRLEAPRLVQGEVSVDLVRAHVVVADAELPHGLEQAVGADDVRLHEGLGIPDRVVVVGLRRIVDDRIMAGDDALQELRIADVTHDELHLGLREACYVCGVPCIGELVEDRHMRLRVVPGHPAHEVGPYEAAAARDDYVLGLECL